MKRCILVVLVGILQVTGQTYGQAVAPFSDLFISWEPCVWQQGFNTFADDAIKDLVVDQQGPPAVIRQGYEHRPFVADPNNLGVGNCTRGNWETIKSAGILLIDTHGGLSSFVVATSVVEQDLWDWANAVNVNAPGVVPLNPNHFTIAQDGNYGGWVLMLNDNYFLAGQGAQIQAALVANDAIVALAMCKGWDNIAGRQSIASVIGGRAVLSYENSIFGNLIVQDLEKLFGYMSGVLPANPANVLDRGSRRILKDAYGTLPQAGPCQPGAQRGDFEYTWGCWKPNTDQIEYGSYDCSRDPTRDPIQDECDAPKRSARFHADPFVEDGLETTIAPAVALDQNKKRQVSPVGDQGITNTGTGCVVFDTVCDAKAGDDASDVLHAEGSDGSNFKLKKVRWVSSSRIEFTWSVDCDIDWEADLCVVADKVTAPGSGVKLDGNEDPEDNNPGGIAPNQDNFTWEIFGQVTPAP